MIGAADTAPAPAPNINSQGYWERRFDGSWEADHGPEQTRFFCELALATLPAWLREQITAGELSLCDWGCALGEGTELLARELGTPVVGVDFSAVAVRKASSAFPHLRFLCEDWLSAAPGSIYDVVFSSNTLEHFDEPWRVFARIAEQARRHVVLLVPFREPVHSRITEHHYTFDPEHVPLSPLADWCLADVHISDLGPSPFWSGQQALLVYSRTAELAAIGLSESRCEASRIVSDGPTCARRHTEVQEALRQRDAHTAAIELLLGENRALQARCQALQSANQSLVASWSWRLGEPLRRLARLVRAGRR